MSELLWSMNTFTCSNSMTTQAALLTSSARCSPLAVRSHFLGVSASLLALTMLIFLGVPDAHAQYFGRNKVQYDTFNFR